MEKVYIDDNIYCIENFLEEKYFNALLADALSEEDWVLKPDGIGNSKTALSKEANGSIVNLNEKLKTLLDSEELYFGGAHDIHRFIPNGKSLAMQEHYDSSGHEGKENELKYGIVYYLNDNFEGGELSYPRKNIKIKPKPNMLVVHPGSEDYAHEVLGVSGNIRYVITGFVFTRIGSGNE